MTIDRMRCEPGRRLWRGRAITLVDKAAWAGPADIKAQFGMTVDFVGDNRVIFDIGGNTYRLIAHIAYAYRRVLIKFVGTHKYYDRIDPETV